MQQQTFFSLVQTAIAYLLASLSTLKDGMTLSDLMLARLVCVMTT
jgi:hypothetical protein